MTTTASELVREYWRLMGTNDFESVAAVLDEDVVLDWPQSGERIRGPANIARVNAEYPSSGPWRFRLQRLVDGGATIVTEVEVTDGALTATAVSFFEVRQGRIVRIREFWPESYEAPEWRRHLVEPLR